MRACNAGSPRPASKCWREPAPAFSVSSRRSSPQRLSAYAAARIGVDSTFLKDSLSAGFGYRPGRAGFGVDYAHYREYFGGFSADTLSGRVTFALTDAVDASLTIGATEGDAFDTIAFGGIGLQTRF